MSANILTFIINTGISFFLSPFIVRNVGVDAYGFIGLANNFISYATLITVAVNSLSGRFVTVKIYENDMESANKYFSSVFIANSILASFMAVIFTVLFIFLEYVITIPAQIFWDVKILFALLFTNCIITTVFSVFNIATFATNKLYLSSLRSAESHILKALIVVPLLLVFTPRVTYLGLSTLICGIYTVVFNIYYTKKLVPDLRVRRKYFNWNAIKELVFSGVWSLISRLGKILLEGVDLLVANIFINPIAMGILSISKTIPGVMSSIVGSVAGVFSPDFTILYAKKQYDELLKNIKQSMKIMGILTNIPIIVLIVCGDLFYSLWQPTQDAKQLHILSLIACATVIFSGGINCIYNVFTVVNKLKVNSLVVIASGFLTTIIVVVLLKITNLGVYAIAGVSTVIGIIRNIAFTAPYGAKCLGLKWYTFLPDVFRPALLVLISTMMGVGLKYFIAFEGWIGLILLSAIMVIISGFIGLFVILSKQERNIIFAKLRKR